MIANKVSLLSKQSKIFNFINVFKNNELIVGMTFIQMHLFAKAHPCHSNLHLEKALCVGFDKDDYQTENA